MLLRIALVVALLTGIGGLVVSFNVSKKITEISSARDTFKKEREEARSGEAAAKKGERDMRVALEDTQGQLSDTESQLEQAQATATEQTGRANDLNQRLLTSTQQRNRAQSELARWQALGLSVEQVLTMRGDLANTRVERDSLTTENGLLSRSLASLTDRINQLILPDYEVKLPSGVSGKVTAVDPRFNFVVLNIGSNDDIRNNAKLAVSRDGKLVGKVRVASVEDETAIANVLPGWKLGEIREGDVVMASYEALENN
jgi:multidrug resistance efflux pump